MLERKTAIITGGSRGIGLAIAKELSDQGAEVIICSRTEDQVKRAVEELSTPEKKAYGMVVDISSFDDCKKLIELAYSIRQRIDILVNNAGIFGPVGPLETNSPDEWKKALSVNLLGAVYCSMLSIPYMKKQRRGKIINLAGAGVGGSKPLPRFSVYYTSKAAIVSFTETLASELESHNIQVNAIAPGGVATDLTLGLLKLDKALVGEEMHLTSKELLEHGGTSPELAAKLVNFLASNDANHITGRLLSAKWDHIDRLRRRKRISQNKYRLRRIDNELFSEKQR